MVPPEILQCFLREHLPDQIQLWMGLSNKPSSGFPIIRTWNNWINYFYLGREGLIFTACCSNNLLIPLSVKAGRNFYESRLRAFLGYPADKLKWACDQVAFRPIFMFEDQVKFDWETIVIALHSFPGSFASGELPN